MTSHHDAGLCERLRVNTCRYADETEEAAAKRRIATDLAAADLLESQAKALSEQKVAYDGLMKAKETFRAEAHRNAARALAAEANLAEAIKHIESADLWTDENYDVGDWREGARTFTNAAKEKT